MSALLLKWAGRNPNFTSPLLEGQCNFLTIFHWHSWHSVFTIPGQKVTWWSVTLGKGFCSPGANKIVNSFSVWYSNIPRSLYVTRRRVMLSPPQILWFSYLLKSPSLIVSWSLGTKDADPLMTLIGHLPFNAI